MLGLFVAWISFDPRLSIIGDNAEFITLGRSLASGKGLTYINAVEEVPATKYPFGFPVILAAIHLIAPNSITAMKLFVLGTFAVSLPCIYLVLSIVSSRSFALVTTVLTAFSIYLLSFASIVLSEVPYTLASFGAILLVLRARASDDFKRHLAPVVALMVAYYLRSAGISLVAAVFVYFFLQKRYRIAGFYGGGCFLLALPWQIRTSLVGGPSYTGTWLLSVDPYRLDAGTLTPLGLVERVIVNVQAYGTRELPRVFWPGRFDHQFAQEALSYDATAVGFGVLLSLLLAIFIANDLRHRGLIGLYLFFYAGICLLWPQVWASVRLVLPVVPLILYGIIRSTWDLARLLPIRNASWVAELALCGLFLTQNVSALATHRQLVTQFPPNFDNYYRAAEWLRSNTPDDAIICCRKAYLMFVIANRKTVGYPFTENKRRILDDLEASDVDYVVIDHISSSTARYLVPAIMEEPSRFEQLTVIRNPDTYVLKFKG